MLERKGIFQLLCSWRGLSVTPVSPGLFSEMSKSLFLPPTLISLFFKMLVLSCICKGCLCTLFLRVGILLPKALWALPQPTAFLNKFWALSPASCKNSQKSTHLSFKGKCYENEFSPFLSSLMSIFHPFPYHCLPPHHRCPSIVHFAPNLFSSFLPSSLWLLLCF